MSLPETAPYVIFSSVFPIAFEDRQTDENREGILISGNFGELRLLNSYFVVFFAMVLNVF